MNTCISKSNKLEKNLACDARRKIMLAWLHFVNAISKSLMDTTDEFNLKRVFLLNNGKQATKNKASYRSVQGEDILKGCC